MAGGAVVVRPIEVADATEVAAFLHRELNPAVSTEAWLRLLRPPWGTAGPNLGFQLRTAAKAAADAPEADAAEDTLVGVYAAVYSERPVDGEPVAFCNLAAFCVLEPYRLHSLRLIRPLLAQKGFVFTDLSPSGNVVAMNERLGFTRLDTATRLIANVPGSAGRGTEVTGDPARLAATLTGTDAQVYADHRDASAARHVLVVRGDRYAYLVYRRDRRKRLPLFASPLYVGGDRTLLQSAWPGVRRHLLRRGLPFTLGERRVVGDLGGLGRELGSPRAKMFRGTGIEPAAIDYLYSELALVSW